MIQSKWTILLLAFAIPLLASLLPAGEAKFQPPKIHVPDGFTVELAAGPPLVKYPMMAGFDDRGRLFVAESAGLNLRSKDLLKDPPNLIRMLEDTNGDGRFDKSTVFADKMTLPMGALWHRGALYVASPPSIWRLEDTDGDGVADKREEIVKTFGFNGNAASIHGCFLGPCGRIYWCDGRHGHEFFDENGKPTSKGKAARIFSCLPDGSDVRVFCGGGMDNPVEVDFMPTGEMLGTVNILLSKPRVDCLMHWVDGGVYPRHDQQACIAEFKRTGDILPPMTNLGHVAVSGMTRYRSGQFGQEFKNNVFITLFNTHKVIRSIPRRSGSTFETTQKEFLSCDSADFHPTDVLEDADGSLLVIDTGGWFRIGCPVSQVAKPQILGAIYRIRRTGSHKVDDPRGLKLGWKKMTPKQLAAHLDDPRPVVREKAIDYLARAGKAALPALRAVVKDQAGEKTTVKARRNAVWALSRIDVTGDAFLVIDEALLDKSESVRLAAARAAGESRFHRRPADALLKMAVSDTPPIRRAAARSLGRICRSITRQVSNTRPETIKVLFESLRQSSTDRVNEHAAINAIMHMEFTNGSNSIRFLQDPNPRVRRAALIVLDQFGPDVLTRQLVAPLLDTDDPALQKTALEIISKHEGWAGEILGLLEKWLVAEEPLGKRAATIRGVLLAFQRDAKIQSLVAQTLSRKETPRASRLLLLEVIARSSLKELPESWLVQLSGALTSKDPRIKRQAVATTATIEVDRFDEQLVALSRTTQLPSEIRVAALAILAKHGKPLDVESFELLSKRIRSPAPPLERLNAAAALGAAKLTEIQIAALAQRIVEAGPLELPVLLAAFEKTTAATIGLRLAASLAKSPGLSSLSASRLEKLFEPYPAEVRQAAAPLLKRLQLDVSQQKARLAELAPRISGGDVIRGRAVFLHSKTACAACHRINGSGGIVGPDLSTIGKIRTAGDLLEAIVFPSASFARGFESYAITTGTGHAYSGVILRETADAIYLQTVQRAEIRLPRGEIEHMAPSRVSVMPQGLDKTMSEAELRDLIAYLRSLK